ncbi:MAG: carbohydrate ABC transporter permease [Actinobacteria bacterium]|nr:carbohydrate ABC transporter permease [Actinomycetota bacterium]
MTTFRRAQPANATVLVLMCAYFVLPLWWLAVSATKTQGELVQDSGLFSISDHFLSNVADLLARDSGVFGRWLVNSMLYAGIGAAIGTVLAAAVGYALSKYRFPGRDALFNVILAGVLIPPAALALPLFLMFSRVGLTNTYWSVLLPSVVSPLAVYLARVSIDAAVPDEVVEAASVDGAGGVRTFVLIGLPMMGPGLVTIFLFQFVLIWNNFMLPLIMLNSSDLYPVTLGLYNWSGQFIQDPTLATSVLVGALIAVVPVIAGFLLLQRFWNTGLTQGAVKA